MEATGEFLGSEFQLATLKGLLGVVLGVDVSSFNDSTASPILPLNQKRCVTRRYNADDGLSASIEASSRLRAPLSILYLVIE